MNEIVVLSSLSLLAFTATAIILIVRRTCLEYYSRVFVPLLVCVLLYGGIETSNVLEHSGITSFFDPLEDLAEVVFTLTFLFFVYQWRRARAEHRFGDLFKHAAMPLAVVGRDGRILEANKIMSEVLHNCFGISMASKPTLNAWWQNAFPGAEERSEVSEAWRKTVAETRKTGTACKIEEREMTCQDGSKKTVILGGSVIGENLLLSMVDITERKLAEAEKEKLTKQLHQAQKLEAIGTLAGGVAHDFNNILSAIMGYAELCLEEMPAESASRENVAKILEAAEVSSGLTRQLLIFARKQTASPVIVDLNSSVETMLKMLRRLIGENIALAWLPSADANCQVKIDPTHLDQILVNLCVNSRDAIDNVGQITIRTKVVQFDQKTCRAHVDCNPGRYAQLSVTDDGCGMDKETAQHVFEPFFSTKGVECGTGLGLSTVYGIVKQSEGFVSLYSEVGHGTTMDIYLPLQTGERDAPAMPSGTSIPRSNNETILLVEDETMIADMSREILERLGYRVHLARRPDEALEVVEGIGTSIDLVLTDVIMPGMNGRELRDRILRLYPDMRFVFMSGYTADVVIHQGIVENEVLFIQKPFSKRDIANKLREAFDGKTG